ncbi:uncharacterized protein LOC114131320 isoform X2 [Aphis gossypii]|uniref:Uncharacterized protein n=2 Tax=Aphis gossypii TaxID=80765 RepID=A0A9P0IZ92_APHGO|nr:uncharacterized protein LOC114131320 isoform X2 [Aphis gossypii]CAH1724094.1 unnamed protein product [Aphis gossypii]
MVHIRTILTLYIVILAVNNVLVEAGQGTNNRRDNLKERASTHKNVLKKYEDRFTNKFGSSINQHIAAKLTAISYIIIDHIIVHESFSQYLKSVFEVLRKYAVRQIDSRFTKLRKIYKKWEKKNFPDKKKKANALKILKNQEKRNKNNQDKGNKGVEKKNLGNEKKSKKKDDK